jgi:predicted MarR family transcription regulator
MSNRPTKLTTFAVTKKQAASIKRLVTHTVDAEMQNYFENTARGDRARHVYHDVKTAALALAIYSVEDFERFEGGYNP